MGIAGQEDFLIDNLFGDAVMASKNQVRYGLPAGVWRTFYHTGPPLGLSRDLIIRGLADKLQLRAHGGPSRALQRRVRILADEFEEGACSFDPGGMLKTGATLVRQ